MYFWKCWRGSRLRFIAMAAIVVGSGALVALYGSFSGQFRAAVARGAITPEAITAAWREGMTWMAGIGGFLMWVAGIWLGASGIGEELQTGSASFLLTRPRRRGHFVWTSLALGAAQLFALACLLALSTFLALLYFTGHVGTWRVFAPVPAFFVTGIVWFGFTQLLAVLLRGTRNAIIGAVVANIFYRLGSYAVFYRGIPPPTMGDVYSQLFEHIPILASVAWLGLALAFVLAGQLVVQRAEV